MFTCCAFFLWCQDFRSSITTKEKKRRPWDFAAINTTVDQIWSIFLYPISQSPSSKWSVQVVAGLETWCAKNWWLETKMLVMTTSLFLLCFVAVKTVAFALRIASLKFGCCWWCRVAHRVVCPFWLSLAGCGAGAAHVWSYHQDVLVYGCLLSAVACTRISGPYGFF